MPGADPAFTSAESFTAFVIVALAAFLVTWIVTDLLHVTRPAYVAILAVVTAALGGIYLFASGTSLHALVLDNAAWGLLGGLVAAAITAPLVRKLPAGVAPHGARRVELLAWEDVLYGTCEALLLATYPVLMLWQAGSIAGWTDGTAAAIAWGVVAIAGSLLVILVHHLGYEEFRQSFARTKLLGALVTCGLQAIAFLLTGNVLAPVLAHMLLHLQMTMRGVELPPVAARV